MKEINIAQVLTHKRREKGITQDELAAYIGVSKASVSKWETEQSYPDITLLPRLAAYFNISIDDLMGYAPQMERGEINRLYRRLASDFAAKPFETVRAECADIVRKYYACFPLLFRIAALYVNHCALAQTPESRLEVLQDAAALLRRVCAESEDVWLTRDATTLEALGRLMLNAPQDALDLLGEEIRPISEEGTLIAQAYQMLGNRDKATEVLQVGMYQHLLQLLGMTAVYLALCGADGARAVETARRALAVMDAYDVDALHPNTAAQVCLAGAQAFAGLSMTDDALRMLRRYVALCAHFHFTLAGDGYFDAIGPWLKGLDLGSEAPRDERLIRESILAAVTQNPAFAAMADDVRFRALIEALKQQNGSPTGEHD